MNDTEYKSDRSAIQIANADAFAAFMESVGDGLIGRGAGAVLTASNSAYHLRDLADRILIAMDRQGVGLHRHDVPPRENR